MVTFKDSIYLQLNWQRTLLMPSWRAAVLGHLGTPAQLTRGRAATTQTQHEGWAEPCQVDNPAQTNSGFLPGVLSCPHTAAVVPAPGTVGGPWHCVARLCLWGQACLQGQKQCQGASPHLGEASLIFFQNQDHYHHHPILHRNEKLKHLKKGKGGIQQSSDTKLVTCSIPVTNKHHAGVGQVFRLHYPQVSLHESETIYWNGNTNCRFHIEF